MVKKASKKKEEEPDFEKKRLILAPSDAVDRRISDYDTDDSHGIDRAYGFESFNFFFAVVLFWVYCWRI